MANENINRVLERATVFATENEHEYLTAEHLLWSLLQEKDVQKIISDIGGKPNIIRNEVEQFLTQKAYRVPAEKKLMYQGPLQTTALRRIFQRALTSFVFAGRALFLQDDLKLQASD